MKGERGEVRGGWMSRIPDSVVRCHWRMLAFNTQALHYTLFSIQSLQDIIFCRVSLQSAPVQETQYLLKLERSKFPGGDYVSGDGGGVNMGIILCSDSIKMFT